MKAAFATPFDLQVEFLKRKLDLPTATWRDIRHGQHDTSFVVAGAVKADLLADLHAAVIKAASEGRGIDDFRRDFKAIVAKLGWTGWTGEGTPAGEAWRTRVIYQTNMTTSHAAGRWAQINDPDLAEIMPYITYHHADGVMHPRPHHLAWNGLTLPKDHPFWRTHATPNGWGCRCYLSAATRKDYARAQAAGKTEPPAGWDALNHRTGAPVGIDKGWAYAPGASRAEELQRFAAEKAAKLPESLGDALLKDVARLPKSPVAQFVEQKTAKACAEWAVKNNLADYADYTGIKPEVANAWNKGLFDSLREFPELRKNQRFTGSTQARNAYWFADTVEKYIPRLRAANPNMPADYDFRPAAIRHTPKPKVDKEVVAVSQKTNPLVKGVTINARWGAKPADLNRHLDQAVAEGWFPPGCNTVRATLDHEIGHQLDNLLSIHLDSEVILAHKEAIAKGMKTTVSGYAAHKGNPIDEFIAECWSEACNNPSPRDTARRVAEIIRNRYRATYPDYSGK